MQIEAYWLCVHVQVLKGKLINGALQSELEEYSYQFCWTVIGIERG